MYKSVIFDQCTLLGLVLSLWSTCLFPSEVFSSEAQPMWLELVFSDNHVALLLWTLPGKCHLCPRAVRTPCPISQGAGTLALRVCLSSGHWHWDDTRRVGVQPGNNRQVRVKGKAPTAPSSLSLKAAPDGEDRSQRTLDASFSRNILRRELCVGAVGTPWDVISLYCHRDLWGSFCYFID